MSKPETIIIDGHAYNWARLCELRRRQLEAWRAAEARQLALFEVKNDCRPAAERTAAGRYQEPTLLALIQDDFAQNYRVDSSIKRKLSTS